MEGVGGEREVCGPSKFSIHIGPPRLEKLQLQLELMIDIRDIFLTYWYHSYRLRKREKQALPSTKMTIILTNSCCCENIN